MGVFLGRLAMRQRLEMRAIRPTDTRHAIQSMAYARIGLVLHQTGTMRVALFSQLDVTILSLVIIAVLYAFTVNRPFVA